MMKRMKTLLLFCLITGAAQCAVHKTTNPAAPSSPATATSAAPTAGKPVPNVTPAVSAFVSNYFRSKQAGSSNATVASVSVRIGSTEPVSGWENRFHTRGEAVVTTHVGGKAEKQTHSFETTCEVVGGAVKVIDINTF